MYVTFHEQQECVYDFPSLSLATGASADVSELVFKQEGLSKKNFYIYLSATSLKSLQVWQWTTER